jgi:hypothetical protein
MKRYVISRMNPAEQIAEATSRDSAVASYEAAIAATPESPIRVLDRQKHEVIVQNF